jgi:hypothetical protein
LGPNTYSVVGTVGPEMNGKLTLDSRDAARDVNSQGELELIQTIRGNTRIDGGDPGFYLGDAVSVTVIYDLIVPDHLRRLRAPQRVSASFSGEGKGVRSGRTGQGKKGQGQEPRS